MPSISVAASFPGSSAWSTTQTLAPSSAKRRADSRPIPLAAPVMTATFPSRRPGISGLLRREVDVLDLGVVVEGVRAQLAPHARLLHPAEGCRDAHRGVGVDGDDARLYAAGHAQGAGAARGPDRAREAVDRVVREAYGVLFVLEGDHGHHRAEDLLARRPVVVGDWGEDGGRVPEARALRGAAPDRHGRVVRHEGGDLLAVIGRDKRSHLRLLVLRVPDAEALDRRLEEVEEVVEDRALHEDARAGAAVLPRVVEDRGGGGGPGLLQVGVGEEDARRLAAELEGDPLDRPRGGGHDLAPHLGRAREGDLRHVGVLGEALADLAAWPHDDVDRALGVAGLVRYPLELEGGQRGDLGRLEHEGVAGGEGRGHLPARDLQREVPGDYEADDAERLAEGHVDAAGDGDRLAEQPLRRARVVAEGLDYHVDLALGAGYGLADVARLEPHQVLPLGVERLGQPAQETRAVGRL